MIYRSKYDPLHDLEQPMIRGCIEGNRSSQRAIYYRYATKMRLVCQRYAKNKDEADEIMQEGFYLVFKNIHQYRFTGSFEGWLRKIIVHAAIQRYKTGLKLHRVIPIQRDHFQIQDQEDSYSALEMKEMIEMIQSLPNSYRMVFNLYVFEGYKHREIAGILGISEGTSKSNLYDARQLLQKAVHSNYGNQYLKTK